MLLNSDYTEELQDRLSQSLYSSAIEKTLWGEKIASFISTKQKQYKKALLLHFYILFNLQAMQLYMILSH